jgi:hypothetical protein
LVSAEPAGSIFGVEPGDEGNNAYQKFWCVFVTTRDKIAENLNLHMNFCEHLDSNYVIVYSLCNSLFVASTAIFVAVPGSNLNRVTGCPNSN